MGMYFPEATLLPYMGVNLLLGGSVIYKLWTRQVKMGKRCAFGTLLLCLLEMFCLLVLPDCLGLTLFSLMSVLFYVCMPSAEMLPVDSKAVLITGCDSGIGYALAKYLDTLGFSVFAGVLKKDGQGAEELKMRCSHRLSLLQLDITNSAQIKEAYIEMKSVLHDKGLWGIVNNAGVLGYVVDGELLPMKVYRQCMEVNFFGAVEVSKTFFPLLRQAQGRLVNISSMAGHIPMPGMAGYGASKAALAMFSGVMRQELSKWGVNVAAVYPGGFKTGILGSQTQWAEQHKNILESIMPETKDDYGEDYIFKLKNCYPEMMRASSTDLSPVLHDVRHALLAKRPNCLYTPNASALPFLFHHFPLWIYDAIIFRMFGSNKNLPRRAFGMIQNSSK
ncbi:estradiol 17-beta-dehydrogenase 2 [Rhinatrema bivittatum]|uniref:estradiol 17-beta-dehydrogenase 2 n=1 Tax=Rhinatrema bivittatum TaxID=194408 RepID=UPI00112C5A50|nr:estradiol 17-beta-dehydrogenase 2 [Rhinatrema bivittatum]